MAGSDLEALDKDWSNYWQGRTAASAGSALVGIENHPAIRKFWESHLCDFPKKSKALDVACGAGTVAKVLDSLEYTDISGLDISQAAIDIMAKSLPKVQGFVSPADATPFGTDTFDLIVSQYGFEYGDFTTVIPEMARILKPGGSFVALSHKTGGGIHQEVSQQLEEIAAIKHSEFIPAARLLFTAAMGVDRSHSEESVGKVFKPAQTRLLHLAKANHGLAEHLYVNTQMMFKERVKYHYKDIMGWLDGMEDEVERFIGRMTSMKTAAIDDDKNAAMHKTFEANGFAMQAAKALIDDRDEALGWIICGQKTA